LAYDDKGMPISTTEMHGDYTCGCGDAVYFNILSFTTSPTTPNPPPTATPPPTPSIKASTSSGGGGTLDIALILALALVKLLPKTTRTPQNHA
jgi:hypothetical protein